MRSPAEGDRPLRETVGEEEGEQVKILGKRKGQLALAVCLGSDPCNLGLVADAR